MLLCEVLISHFKATFATRSGLPKATSLTGWRQHQRRMSARLAAWGSQPSKRLGIAGDSLVIVALHGCGFCTVLSRVLSSLQAEALWTPGITSWIICVLRYDTLHPKLRLIPKWWLLLGRQGCTMLHMCSTLKPSSGAQVGKQKKLSQDQKTPEASGRSKSAVLSLPEQAYSRTAL